MYLQTSREFYEGERTSKTLDIKILRNCEMGDMIMDLAFCVFLGFCHFFFINLWCKVVPGKRKEFVRCAYFSLPTKSSKQL